MPVTFRIHFDRPHAAYFAGEVVVGRLVMYVDKPKKIRAVTVQFKGEANVRWSESSTVHKKQGAAATSETVSYSSHETYFQNTLYFLGAETGELQVRPGEFSFDFQCMLPHTLPSSFEGAYGHIRYTAKAVMHRPWKFDHGAKAAFTVVAPLDLNAMPQAKAPIHMEASKHFCCLWCRSGPLTVTVHLPAGGYVPGQVIFVRTQVDNASRTRIEGVTCSLSKEVKWHANKTIGSPSSRLAYSKTRVTTANVVEMQYDGEVDAHGSKVFSQMISVPAVPPSNLSHCSIIDLQYALKVTARVGACQADLDVRVPLLIGTIPVVTGAPPVYPGSSAVQDAVNAPAAAMPTQAFHSELPPPSYEECVFKGNNIMDGADDEYTMGVGDFTPRYPVWAFNAAGPASAPEL